jgi:predicted nucleotidyltransferase
MVATNIAYNQEELVAFCRKHHIRKLAFFGSVIRDDFQPTSDIDVLVEFDSQHIPGLAFFGMETELSKIFGYPVDLNTLAFLSPYFRKRVESEAHVAYEQT